MIRSVFIFAWLMSGLVTAAWASPATTVPASTRPDDAMSLPLSELASADPEVRASARTRLMAMDRGSLTELRQQIAEGGHVGPNQAAALRDIVRHVYLAGQEQPSEPDKGFLGVAGSTENAGVVREKEGPQVGIVVIDRVPGTPGYRLLQDGDVILRLTTERGVFDMNNPGDLPVVVQQQKPGDTITLDLLRRGKQIQVPITLIHRPTDQALRERAAREREADDYWNRNFQPLLGSPPP